MLLLQNEYIKPAYLEEGNKVFNDLPNEIREDICAMSFSMFKNKLKNYLFDKANNCKNSKLLLTRYTR